MFGNGRYVKLMSIPSIIYCSRVGETITLSCGEDEAKPNESDTILCIAGTCAVLVK